MAKRKGKSKSKKKTAPEKRRRLPKVAPKKGKPSKGKKTPARTVKPSGRRPTPQQKRKQQPAKKKVPTGAGHVKAPAPKRHRPGPGPRPAPSTHPEAIRSRKRRAEAKGIAEALAAERERKLEQRRQRDRERRKRKKGIIGGGGPSLRELATGWLETIRNHCAEFVPTSLEIVDAEAASRGTWAIVGKLDFLEDVSYLTLGEILERLLADDILAVRINPSRLTQIRIVFMDPNVRQFSGGGSYVSAIAAWEFALGDLIGEILGGGASDEMSLAARYDQSKIPTAYFYFSSETKVYETAMPGAKTASLPLR